MTVLEDVGELLSTSDPVQWVIPNFYELPQKYDTVIRSPLFHFKERECYIQVYPNGCSLQCSSGWFGIDVLHLNSDSTDHSVKIGIAMEAKQYIVYRTGSCERGLYSCMKFLPTLLLKYARNTLVPGGNLHVFFFMDEEIDILSVNEFTAQLSIEKAHNLFNAYKQTSRQAAQQIVKEEWKPKHDGICREELTQVGKESEIPSEIIDVGEIVDTMDEKLWIIPNFYKISQKYNTVLKSPPFRLKDRDWYIQIYPNGCSSHECSFGWFGFGIFNMNSDANCCIFMRFAFGEQTPCIGTKINLYGKTSYNYTKFLPTSFLKPWKGRLLEEGNLHVYLGIETDTEEDEQEEIIINLEREDMEKCFDVCVQAAKQTMEEMEEIGIRELQQNFKDLLLKGNMSDVVLKVKDQEFRAHRCILASRSPVFLAMMTHETKEKISGFVEIKDSEPNCFADFLNYVYTGSVENITPESALKLYVIADKYQVDGLKQICLDHMMQNISVEDFCDILALSIVHAEKRLTDACTQFFLKKSLDIVITSKWELFLNENATVGNELFIKHLQLHK